MDAQDSIYFQLILLEISKSVIINYSKGGFVRLFVYLFLFLKIHSVNI